MRVRSLAVTASIASGVIVTTVFVQSLSSSSAQTQQRYLPGYTASGDLKLPPNEIWREWVFVGDPFTPIALNGGKACPEPNTSSSGPCTGFPEYHNVYSQPGAYAIYQNTKEFAEGAVL